MKIAIVSYWFYESTIPLANALAERGLSVTLYMIVTKSYLKKNYVLEDLEINIGFCNSDSMLNALVRKGKEDLFRNFDLRLMVVDHFSRRDFFSRSALQIKLLRSVYQGKFDVINVVGDNVFLQLLILFFKKNKLVVTLHEVKSSRITNESNGVLEKSVKRKLKFIFHSNYVRDSFSNAFPSYDKKRLNVVKFGPFKSYQNLLIEVKEVNNLFHPNDFVVLYYGSIYPYKGVGILLEAAARLSELDSAIKFIIAGHGQLSSKLPINTYAVNRFLKEGEISFLHQISKITVCPYIEASQSGIPMTSFLFGKPVIATNVGAFEEYISDGFSGLLVNDVSVEGIVDAILLSKRAIAAGSLSVKNIESEWRYESSRLNWRNLAAMTSAVYENKI